MLKIADYDEFNGQPEPTTDEPKVEQPKEQPVIYPGVVLGADHICDLLGIKFPFQKQGMRRISDEYVPVSERQKSVSKTDGK